MSETNEEGQEVKYGETIKKARIKAGYTQQQLADETGLTMDYIELVETDEQSPSVENFFKICRVLNVNGDEEVIDGSKLRQDVGGILEKHNTSGLINDIRKILENQ